MWVAGAVILLPVLLVLLVLIAANTGAGQRLIAQQAGSLTGGMVKLTGLSGRFPDALRLARLELQDAHGTWLTAEGVTLDWSPTALVFRRARIERADIGRLAVSRLPVAAPARPAPAGQGGFSLPVSVDLRALTVGRLELGAAVAGLAAALQVSGHAHLASLQAGSAALAIARLDGPGRYQADGVLSPATITAHLRVQEPQGGLIAGLAKLPALGALAVTLDVDGPKTAERAHLVASAGPLAVTGDGSADLPARTATLSLAAHAPAMRPRPDIAWRSIDLAAHLAGSFSRPDATAHLAIDGLAAGGASLTALVADVAGNQGRVAPARAEARSVRGRAARSYGGHHARYAGAPGAFPAGASAGHRRWQRADRRRRVRRAACRGAGPGPAGGDRKHRSARPDRGDRDAAHAPWRQRCGRDRHGGFHRRPGAGAQAAGRHTLRRLGQPGGAGHRHSHGPGARARAPGRSQRHRHRVRPRSRLARFGHRAMSAAPPARSR